MASKAERSSVWDRPNIGSPNSPNFCPVCGEELAHVDDMAENDDLDADPGYFEAYRRHRQAHYRWGDDPKQDWDGNRDPYLAHSYDGDGGADTMPRENEQVGSVYTVRVNYNAVKKATVVATCESQAKEKVQYDELPDGEDFHGHTPEVRAQEVIHTDVTEQREVTRGDEELAERMEGWPW